MRHAWRLRHGEAKITPGFRLPARYVIHTVGPVWGGGERGEDRLLADCYRNSLALAVEQGLTSIAFPAISTGIYGFPPARAAHIAVGTVRERAADLPSIERVMFCCFGKDSRSSPRDRACRGARARANDLTAPIIVWFRNDLRLADHPALDRSGGDRRSRLAALHPR